MCGLSCLEIVHCVPRIHARTVSLGNGACLCLWLYMFWAAAWTRLCKMYRQICKYDPVAVRTCTFVHVLTRAFEGVSQIAHSSLCCDYSQNEPLEVGELDNRPTYRRLFGIGEDIHSERHAGALWRMWSSVPHPSIQWRWVHWDEGTYSIPTMLIRDVTLRGKNKSGDPFTFQSFFPRRHPAV